LVFGVGLSTTIESARWVPRLSAARRGRETGLDRVHADWDVSRAERGVGDMMTDAQVADVVTYVRTHFGNAYPGAVLAADVAASRRRAEAPP
jgi:mono/diheme cytochrome c family protein